MSISFLKSKPFPDIPVQFTLEPLSSFLPFTGLKDNPDGITKIWWFTPFANPYDEIDAAHAAIYRFRANILQKLPPHHGLSELGVFKIETVFGIFRDYVRETGPITFTHPRK